jgi:hypothetical protein
MVTVQAALQTIDQYGGKLDVNTGRLDIPAKILERAEIKEAVHVLKKAGPDKVKSVLASVQAHCQCCEYHDIGPDSFGKNVIHWCGPWYEANGDQLWWNLAQLIACPMGRWGVKDTVY